MELVNNNFKASEYLPHTSSLAREFSNHKKSHLLRFAVFLIPVIGAYYKTSELIFTPTYIKEEAKLLIDERKRDQGVKRVIRELQVSDLFFGLATVIHSALALGLGIFTISALPFLSYSIILKTTLFSINKAGFEKGYFEQKSKKLSCVRVKPESSSGKLCAKDIRILGLYTFAYSVPLLGLFVKRNLSIKNRSEYLHLDVSPTRQKHLEKIQKLHNKLAFVARVVTLTALLTLAGLVASHPLALLIFAGYIVSQGYFAGKIEMEDAILGDVSLWKQDALTKNSYEMQDLSA